MQAVAHRLDLRRSQPGGLAGPEAGGGEGKAQSGRGRRSGHTVMSQFDRTPGEARVVSGGEVRGPNLLVARRCDVCGAFAANDPDDDLHRVMGRLPETCRREHGNTTIEVLLVI